MIKKEFTIGRMDADKSYPEDGRMSRIHCRFVLNNDVLTICDLKSKNGTLLNEQLISPDTPTALKNGALLQIGDQVFEVSISGKAKSVPEPAQQVGKITETHKISAITQIQPDDFSRTEVMATQVERTVVDVEDDGFQFDRSAALDLSSPDSSSEHPTPSAQPQAKRSPNEFADFFPQESGADVPKPQSIDVSLLGVATNRPMNSDGKESMRGEQAKIKKTTEILAKSYEPKDDYANSRIQNPKPPKASSSEELVYVRATPPNRWKTLSLGFILLVPVPIYFFSDPDNLFLIQQVKSPGFIGLWLGVILLPAIAITVPIQTVRMRTGWTRGLKSLFLTFLAVAAVSLLQGLGIYGMEKYTGFEKNRITILVKRSCIDSYNPDRCAQVVFTCSQCLTEINYTGRQAILESIYPTIETLTKREVSPLRQLASPDDAAKNNHPVALPPVAPKYSGKSPIKSATMTEKPAFSSSKERQDDARKKSAQKQQHMENKSGPKKNGKSDSIASPATDLPKKKKVPSTENSGAAKTTAEKSANSTSTSSQINLWDVSPSEAGGKSIPEDSFEDVEFSEDISSPPVLSEPTDGSPKQGPTWSD